MLPQILINEEEVRAKKCREPCNLTKRDTSFVTEKKMEPSSDQITGSDFVNVIKGNLAK